MTWAATACTPRSRVRVRLRLCFEAGIAATSLSWTLVVDAVRRQMPGAMLCAYDRAGLGWSEPAGEPRTLDNILRDLHALVRSAPIRRPFVLAGHSFGGLVALEYACRFPNDLCGLVLVDPLAAGEWHPLTPANARMLARGVRLARRGVLLARLGIVRLALTLLIRGKRRIPQALSRISSGNGASLTERIVGEVRKLPPEVWPLIQEHWCAPKSFAALADHLENLPGNAAACTAHCDLGGLPVTVLSAADATPERTAEHARIASLSTRGQVIAASKSGHWIQLDDPELVASLLTLMTVSSSCL